MRAEITKGCRARNIYLTQVKCLASIEQWIAVRQRRGWGLSSGVEFRGLRPDSRLVMTHKGQAFELAFKLRELESGPEVYRACDALQQTISRLYRQAGIKLGSSHSGRRSLAARVLAATGDVETVQTILGHQHLDHSKLSERRSRNHSTGLRASFMMKDISHNDAESPWKLKSLCRWHLMPSRRK